MIRVENLTAGSGEFRLEGVDFTIPSGSYCTLMGRTGSGKTTLIETICGLKRPLKGKIWLGGQDATNWSPAARQIGFVPQEGALFSSMTVGDHLEFALRIRNWEKERLRARVKELAELLQITSILERRPPGLSGGERQRVALGRALSFAPHLLCLDEPLSSLDDATRADMIHLLATVHRETRVTALHVTHHREEADQLADRQLVIEGKQVELLSTKAVKHESEFAENIPQDSAN